MKEFRSNRLRVWENISRTMQEFKVILLGYRSYTALLSQSGTDAPDPIVLDNTVGSIVWTRNSNGIYSGTLTDAFTSSKTALFIQDNVTLSSIAVSPADVWIERSSSDVVNIYTTNSTSLIDNVLNNTTVEIRVYN